MGSGLRGDIKSVFKGRPSLSVPDAPPAAPTLADEKVKQAGLAADQAALASGGGRRAAFITSTTGGESAPSSVSTQKSSQAVVPWDYGLEQLVTHGSSLKAKFQGLSEAARIRRQGTY